MLDFIVAHTDALFGLLGVLVGGGITLFTSLWFAWRAERAERRALAHSIVFKSHLAFNIILEMRRHVITAKGIAAQRGWPLWQAMQELNRPESEKFVFTSPELSLFAENKEADFSNELMILARAHNLLVTLFQDYNPRRESFGLRIADNGGTASVDGERVRFETADQAAPILALRLKQLSESIDDITSKGFDDALHVNRVLNGKLKAILKDPRFTLNSTPPDDIEATL